jgi:hypothetical protein
MSNLWNPVERIERKSDVIRQLCRKYNLALLTAGGEGH